MVGRGRRGLGQRLPDRAQGRGHQGLEGALRARRIGVGAGSISWLKFAASVQENGLEYGKLKIVNIVGGGGNYLKALQGKEIDMAVVWQPFCAQAIVDGFGAVPDASTTTARRRSAG